MVPGSKRALRRKHRLRVRRRAVRLVPHWPDAWLLAEHLKACSCVYCGNPRRRLSGRSRLTLQEIRAGLGEAELLQEAPVSRPEFAV